MDYIYKDESINLKKQNMTIICNSTDRYKLIIKLNKSGISSVSLSNDFSTNYVKNELDNFEMSDNISSYFDLNCLERKAIGELSIPEIAYIKIIIEIAKNNGYIIFDDILTYLLKNQKNKILQYLKENKIILLNLTSNEEEYLFCDYIAVINQQKICLEGNPYEVFHNEVFLKRLGFKLPFIIDLSTQLKYYGLIDKIYNDKTALVEDLWKQSN